MLGRVAPDAAGMTAARRPWSIRRWRSAVSACRNPEGFPVKLLVIDDNHHFVTHAFEYFEARRHVLDTAPDGITGLHLAVTHEYDAVIVQRRLPRLDGLAVLRCLRDNAASNVPVVVLDARDDLADRIDGIRAGADDYLTEPVALPELEVRLEALLARAGRTRTVSRVLRVGDLVLDLATLDVNRANRPIRLYPSCLKLLQLLMRVSPAVVTREALEVALWGDAPPDGDLLRSHVYELRRAIDGAFEQKMIITVARVGYRIVQPGWA